MLFDPLWDRRPDWERRLDAILRDLDAVLRGVEDLAVRLPTVIARLEALERRRRRHR